MTDAVPTKPKAKSKSGGVAKIIMPGEFVEANHFYPQTVGSRLHPAVSQFMKLGNDRIVQRYCRLYPATNPTVLRNLLATRPKNFPWAGADLFNVSTFSGERRMIVIETNSSPSGMKSMPTNDTDGTPLSEAHDGGYRAMMDSAFRPMVEAAEAKGVQGGLCVLYDKNSMEASGYASVLADIFQEPVYFQECYLNDPNPSFRWDDGILFIRAPPAGGAAAVAPAQGGAEQWLPMRGVFRYVTQSPWARIPIATKTALMNPILACLAGGRNKLMAAKAYDLFNSELRSLDAGISIDTPQTVCDVSKAEIPLWVDKFGGHAVVKIPYSNAGQGVFTITNMKDLQEFMESDSLYDRYIVQGLVGDVKWQGHDNLTGQSTGGHASRLYHVGTVPNENGDVFVADMRMMVVAHPETGFRPLAMYARRAAVPLRNHTKIGAEAEGDDEGPSSWDILGTNLSKVVGDLTFTTESERLVLMDSESFDELGIGLDDLVKGYIQTVLCVTAIDRMCCRLQDGYEGEGGSGINIELFACLDPDEALVDEVRMCNPSCDAEEAFSGEPFARSQSLMRQHRQ